MNNLPSPFQNENLPTLINSSPNRPSTSPGFLMLTRPAHASTIGPDGRGRSMGRANYKSSHRNNSYSNNFRYNQNRSFDNYYRGQTNNHFQRSPSNDYMSKSHSFSGSPNFHSTPRNYQQNNRRGHISHQRSGSNQSKQRFEKPPLKDVPIDKFISFDMVQDPWKEFESSTHNKTGSKIISSDNDGIDEVLNNINATANDAIVSYVIDDEDKAKSSIFQSSSASSLVDLVSSSPRKERETESDS